MSDDRQAVQEWTTQRSPAEQEQVRWLAHLVRSADEGVAEAIKWRRPTFTVNGNWHHWLCGISVTKQAVSLMFHKGSLLDDPTGVLRGEGRYLRQVPYAVAVQAPEAVTALVRQAIAHQTDMLDQT